MKAEEPRGIDEEGDFSYNNNDRRKKGKEKEGGLGRNKKT